MEENKPCSEEIFAKKETEPAEATENGSVNGGVSSPSNSSKNLETLSNDSPGAGDMKDEEDKPESTSWLLTGWGVHYGSRD